MGEVIRAWTAGACAFTPEQALHDALNSHAEAPLHRVLVIGEYEDGELFIRSSRITREQTNWLIDRAKHDALSSQLHMDDEDNAR